VAQQWGRQRQLEPKSPSDRQTQNTSPNSRAKAPINFIKCARVRGTIQELAATATEREEREGEREGEREIVRKR